VQHGQSCSTTLPKSDGILALKGSTIVRVSLKGGAPTKLYAVNAISKLVGFDQDNANELLILRENRSGQTEVGLLSLGTGVVAPISYDPASIEDNHLLEHLRSWDRVYGDKSLYVKAQEKHTLSGIVEYVDIFLRVGNGQPLNVSNCDGQTAVSRRFLLMVPEWGLSGRMKINGFASPRVIETPGPNQAQPRFLLRNEVMTCH
jgi:hypothetical protein